MARFHVCIACGESLPIAHFKHPGSARCIDCSSDHEALVDLTGRQLAGCNVLDRAPAYGQGHARWNVTCSCGHPGEFTGVYLRRSDLAGKRLVCVSCRKRAAERARPRKTAPSRHPHICPACECWRDTLVTVPGSGDPDVLVRVCPRCARMKMPCQRCSYLAHRVRPARIGSRCPGCGTAYEPEDPVHAVAGRDPGRVVYPEANDFEGWRL